LFISGSGVSYCGFIEAVCRRFYSTRGKVLSPTHCASQWQARDASGGWSLARAPLSAEGATATTYANGKVNEASKTLTEDKCLKVDDGIQANYKYHLYTCDAFDLSNWSEFFIIVAAYRYNHNFT
jgi:hypothetical protein